MRALLLISGVLVMMAGCRGPKPAGIEDAVGHSDLSYFQLSSLSGTRDGDRLAAQAVFTDSSSILVIDMNFAVGAPTTLRSGTWQWTRNNKRESGSVAERSVTFLGGQDGPPSLGGTFDLLDESGPVRYRVHLPVAALKARLR